MMPNLITRKKFNNTLCLLWGHSSAGRALRWQRRGQGFDPPWLHQGKIKKWNKT